MTRMVFAILATATMLSMAAAVPVAAGSNESLSLNFGKIETRIHKDSKKPPTKASKHKREIPIETYGWIKPKSGARPRRRLRSR